MAEVRLELRGVLIERELEVFATQTFSPVTDGDLVRGEGLSRRSPLLSRRSSLLAAILLLGGLLRGRIMYEHHGAAQHRNYRRQDYDCSTETRAAAR